MVHISGENLTFGGCLNLCWEMVVLGQSCMASRAQTVLRKEPPAIQQVSKAHLCLIMFCACVSVCVETLTPTYISPLTQNIKP